MASEDKLVNLFDAVIEQLIDRCTKPSADTRDLRLAAQICMTSGIKYVEVGGSPIQKLRSSLPFPALPGNSLSDYDTQREDDSVTVEAFMK